MYPSIIKSRKLRKIFTIAFGFYGFALIGFYSFSNRIIFQRTTLTQDYIFSFQQPFAEHFITTSDGAVLHGLFFKSPTPSKGLIFYTHGNADNLSRWGKYAIDFTSLGYDVFMYDYRGYGKSNGTPNIENLQRDGVEVFNWVKVNLPFSNLVMYGRSLGSVVATELAIKTQPDLLILETPFALFEDVIYWPIKPALWLLPKTSQLSNLSTIAHVTCRKIIFHGTEDWVVPLSSPLKLKPYLASEGDFIIIKGAGHRNLRDFKDYHTQLGAILK